MKHTEEDGAEKECYVIEKQQAFSKSLIWDLLQYYFAQRGVAAWRENEVPCYVTSNPTVANSYAEIVWAFFRDQHPPASGDIASDEPLYICELGAGSGRFAFHFLKRLTRLCELSQLPLASFRYVLTDFTQSNLDFWLRHPRFQTFFESGVLDMALFDVNQSDRLALQLNGSTIAAGSLSRPAVVIANYVFDTIPQDLFYINDLGL
jgi:hypothetical protein